MAVPWTNRDQSVFVPLNDYVATFIGMVRDDVAFNTALSADLTYTVSGVTPAASATSNAHYENAENNSVNLFAALQPDDAVFGARHSRRGHRGTADFARLFGSVLRRRHQPRDVPLHDDESHVPRHGAGARHLAAAGSHPPGREPQPGWRQPHLPEQLHRLPQRHGSVRAGLRLLRLRQWHGRSAGLDAPGLHAGRRPSEVLQQRHELRAGLHHS